MSDTLELAITSFLTKNDLTRDDVTITVLDEYRKALICVPESMEEM